MDVIVFVVGGGNYVEYQNIHEYGKSKNLQRIIYGCTELVNPKHFVQEVHNKIMENEQILNTFSADKTWPTESEIIISALTPTWNFTFIDCSYG